jgi:hypothetical protein
MTSRYLWWYICPLLPRVRNAHVNSREVSHQRWYFFTELSWAMASADCWAASMNSWGVLRLLSMSPIAPEASSFSFLYQSPYWATNALFPALFTAWSTEANAVPIKDTVAVPDAVDAVDEVQDILLAVDAIVLRALQRRVLERFTFGIEGGRTHQVAQVRKLLVRYQRGGMQVAGAGVVDYIRRLPPTKRGCNCSCRR